MPGPQSAEKATEKDAQNDFVGRFPFPLANLNA
jgi:hypothetical protein